MTSDFGKTLIAIGAMLIVVGCFFIFRDRIPGLEKMGRLPGDIAVERENFKFYFPLTTSILLSLLLTFLFWLLSRFR